MVEGYRAGIEYLAARGIADPSKVGIVGWSRTSYYVKYALTHSPELFKAAVAVDGVDYGYGQYLAYLDSVETSFALQYQITYGGAPWNDWQSWLGEAPGFKINNVRAPLRIEAMSGFRALLGEWEFYAGMRRLGLPVDFVFYPDGVHSLVRPSQRITSSEGALDWLDYWLNGHEDSKLEKAEQYERWSKLKALQQATVH